MTTTNRGGAPKRNQNAVTHGLRSLSATGRVPVKIRGGMYLQRQVRKFARASFDSFVEIHGREPTLHERIVLKTLARAEARAQLHERLLATEWDSLTHEQRTTSLDRIGSAGDQLIRCSKEAGLNYRPYDPVRDLIQQYGMTAYATPPTGNGSTDAGNAESQGERTSSATRDADDSEHLPNTGIGK